MADTTKIEWCDFTFNAWRGCSKVATGCANCYAEALSKRWGGRHGIWGKDGARVIASEAYWRKPRKWARDARDAAEKAQESIAWALNDGLDTFPVEPHRPRVFCGSMCDVAEDRDELHKPRTRLMTLIKDTPELDWLLMTKRPENVARLFDLFTAYGWPPNVWLGTSVACQEDADKNIPELLRIPAAVRFVSYEPAVGPVDFRPWLESPEGNLPSGHTKGLDWIIVGGESGSGARPFDVEWARSTIQKCRDAGTACFVKQLGAHVVDRDAAATATHFEPVMCWPGPVCERTPVYDTRIRLSNPKGGDPSEWPADLRVREFPGGVS